MIYCPACKKPSARNTGNCPHCGFQFNRSRDTGSRQSDRRPDVSPSPAGIQFGDANIELDDDDSMADAPLDLALEDTEASPVDTFTPDHGAPLRVNHMPSSERGRLEDNTEDAAVVSEIAGFGVCGSSFIEVMKYGLRVFRRLPGLREETEAVGKEKDSCWQSLEAAKARLGRRAAKLPAKDIHFEKLVARAANADGKLANVQREEEAVNRHFGEKLTGVTGRLHAAESEMAPVSEEALRTRNHHQQMLKERSRVNAKIKRTEIELRNIRERIEQKQSVYADLKQPREDRARTLQEITELDHRQAPLLHRLSMEQKELAAIEAPLEAISTQLTRITGQLEKHEQHTSQIKGEQVQIENELKSALDAIHSKARGESKHAQSAWASVGELVYMNKMMDTSALADVQAAAESFFQAQKKLSLHEAALDSYDKNAYQEARKMWIAAAVISGGLLLAIIGMLVL